MVCFIEQLKICPEDDIVQAVVRRGAPAAVINPLGLGSIVDESATCTFSLTYVNGDTGLELCPNSPRNTQI